MIGAHANLHCSKINYLDPRITVAWCNTHEVPIEKLFSKTLLKKCTCLVVELVVLQSNSFLTVVPWALGVENDWKF